MSSITDRVIIKPCKWEKRLKYQSCKFYRITLQFSELEETDLKQYRHIAYMSETLKCLILLGYSPVVPTCYYWTFQISSHFNNSFSRVLSRQCGIPNVSQLYRPPRLVTGVALLYFITGRQNIKSSLCDRKCTLIFKYRHLPTEVARNFSFETAACVV
jgi:hypothetical protein